MSIFGNLFDGFSSRPDAAKRKHVIPERTRRRIFMLCKEIFSNQHEGASYSSGGDYSDQFWDEIHRMLRYRHGSVQFHEHSRSSAEDATLFLLTCAGEEFLNFVEDIFQVKCWFQVLYSPDKMVEDINTLFNRFDLPYSLTSFVRKSERKMLYGPVGERPEASEYDVVTTVSFPRIIMRESEIVHSHAIKPVLDFLQRPEYSNACSEYLAALEDYRNDEFGDCLTKCGSAFESVLKIICHRKGWKYDQKDPAGTLVKTFLQEAKLEPYFDPMLMTTAVLRNKLSGSHGAGMVAKHVPRHVALYAVNVTASAILFVIQQVGEA